MKIQIILLLLFQIYLNDDPNPNPNESNEDDGSETTGGGTSTPGCNKKLLNSYNMMGNDTP